MFPIEINVVEGYKTTTTLNVLFKILLKLFLNLRQVGERNSENTS